MGRRSRKIGSPHRSRLHFLQPKVDKLEDRLQPGSMFDFFGFAATGVASNPDLAELSDVSHDAPVLSVTSPELSTTHVASILGGRQTAGETQRVIRRNHALNEPVGLNNQLDTGPTSTLSLGDIASNELFGLEQDMKTHRPANTKLTQSSKARPSTTEHDIFVSAANALLRRNGVVSSRLVDGDIQNGMPAVGPVSAAKNLETSGPARAPDGGNPYDPNQPFEPYAIAFDGKRDAPTTGVVQSIPEFAPSKGMLLRYGLGNNNVVTDIVARATGDPDYDEIAYVLVTSASQQSSATSAFIAAGADMRQSSVLHSARRCGLDPGLRPTLYHGRWSVGY